MEIYLYHSLSKIPSATDNSQGESSTGTIHSELVGDIYFVRVPESFDDIAILNALHSFIESASVNCPSKLYIDGNNTMEMFSTFNAYVSPEADFEGMRDASVSFNTTFYVTDESGDDYEYHYMPIEELLEPDYACCDDSEYEVDATHSIGFASEAGPFDINSDYVAGMVVIDFEDASVDASVAQDAVAA